MREHSLICLTIRPHSPFLKRSQSSSPQSSLAYLIGSPSPADICC